MTDRSARRKRPTGQRSGESGAPRRGVLAWFASYLAGGWCLASRLLSGGPGAFPGQDDDGRIPGPGGKAHRSARALGPRIPDKQLNPADLLTDDELAG